MAIPTLGSEERSAAVFPLPGPEVDSQAVAVRSGLNWYIVTARELIVGGFNWAVSSESLAPRIEQAKESVGQLSAKVSEVASKTIITARSAIKNSMNPAAFFSLLDRTEAQEVFPSPTLAQTETYDKGLVKYRRLLSGGVDLNSNHQDTAVRIFRGLGLSPAYRILAPYLSEGASGSLSESLKADREAIRKATAEVGQGMLPWLLTRIGAQTRFCDPLKDRGFPFLFGTRKIDDKEKVNIFCHSVPVREVGTVQIAPEYRMFLEACRSQKETLLCCLVELSDKGRFDALYKLSEEFDDVSHFVRMPLDGPLSQVHKFTSLESYKKAVDDDVKEGIKRSLDPKNEFRFGSSEIAAITKANYGKISEFAYGQIMKVYPKTEQEAVDAQLAPTASEKERKHVFMMLVQTLLRSVLIKELGVNHYSNTSNEGSAATTCDLIWSHFLTDTLAEHSFDVRLSASYPAFMASSVIEERKAQCMDALARFVEAASAQGQREEVMDAYTAAGFPIEGKMSFYRPKICYPQVGSEIHASIRGQDSKRDLLLDISVDPGKEMEEGQMLDKLLEIFEQQYNLSFTPPEDAIVWILDLDHQKKKAEGQFVVNDMHIETYGKLTFSIEFSPPSFEATKLQLEIKSAIEIVEPLMSGPDDDEDFPID